MPSSAIEIAPFDNLLVYKKGYTPEFVSRMIREKNLGGLQVFAVLMSERLDSLDFLKDYGFLENLHLTSANDPDFSFLRALPNLKKLTINITGHSEIDLSGQKNLESLTLQWRKKITGLEACARLDFLCLVDLKEKDLDKVKGLGQLRELMIKTASLESLDGAAHLEGLQKVLVGNARKLKSIKALNNLKQLRELHLDTCPKIEDYQGLTSLPRLEVLSLVNNGKVSSLKFIDSFPALSKLSLLGNTVIEDGDLVPAKRIPWLEHQHYRHYNIKLENPEYEKNIKSNLANLKKLLG